MSSIGGGGDNKRTTDSRPLAKPDYGQRGWIGRSGVSSTGENFMIVSSTYYLEKMLDKKIDVLIGGNDTEIGTFFKYAIIYLVIKYASQIARDENGQTHIRLLIERVYVWASNTIKKVWERVRR